MQHVRLQQFWVEFVGSMPPKRKLTAALFQEQYGNLVAEQFAQYTTARTLKTALSKRILAALAHVFFSLLGFG